MKQDVPMALRKVRFLARLKMDERKQAREGRNSDSTNNPPPTSPQDSSETMPPLPPNESGRSKSWGHGKVKGWVYVITNDSMPGLVKIGFSTKDPSLRAQELSSTGMPTDYKVEYEILLDEPYTVEQRTHSVLTEFNVGKEWFQLSIPSAIQVIRQQATHIYFENYVADVRAKVQKEESLKLAKKVADENAAHATAKEDYLTQSRAAHKRLMDSEGKRQQYWMLFQISKWLVTQGPWYFVASCGTAALALIFISWTTGWFAKYAEMLPYAGVIIGFPIGFYFARGDFLQLESSALQKERDQRILRFEDKSNYARLERDVKELENLKERHLAEIESIVASYVNKP